MRARARGDFRAGCAPLFRKGLIFSQGSRRRKELGGNCVYKFSVTEGSWFSEVISV